MPGCDGASVSLLWGDEPSTLASSHDDIRSVDEAQYENDAGPCVSAMREGRPVAVEDFTREDRWPQLTDKAAAIGVRSSLSLPLSDGDRYSVGSMGASDWAGSESARVLWLLLASSMSLTSSRKMTQARPTL